MVEFSGETFSLWFVSQIEEGEIHKARSMTADKVPFEIATEQARLLKEYLKTRTGYSPGKNKVFIVPDRVASVDLDQYFSDNK